VKNTDNRQGQKVLNLLAFFLVLIFLPSCDWIRQGSQMKTTAEAIRKYELVNEIQALPFDTFHYGTNILFQANELAVNPENSDEVFTERDATKYGYNVQQEYIRIYQSERIPWKYMTIEN
jgi:hypothetical protein